VVALKEKTGFAGLHPVHVAGVFGREQSRSCSSDKDRIDRYQSELEAVEPGGAVGAVALIATLLVSGSSLVQALAG